MGTDGNAIAVSVIYVAAAVGLTIWLARTLFSNGAAFLHDVFIDKPDMLSLGYSLYILRASRAYDGYEAVTFLINRLALMLVSLAALHFVNVFVFWRIRARREQRHLPTPVAPQTHIPPIPPTGA
jgi:hypothetical protein